MTRKIVLASNNQKKVSELAAILADEHINVVPQKDFNIEEVVETGTTFVENAIIKARHATAFSHLPAIADDSGICVSALQDAPGVYSARYSGLGDDGNNEKLLQALKNETDRRAYYVCVIVYLRHADDPLPLIAQGIWHGRILESAQGSGGFGYDPLFIPDNSAKTVAQMSVAEKNTVSHRAIALKQFITLYRTLS